MLDIILKLVVLISVRLMGGISFLISIPYYFTTRQKCAAVTNKIILYPARILVKMVSNREITCEEVVNAYISRIKEVNPLLNAVIEDRFEIAVSEAKTIDDFISKSNMSSDQLLERYPLLGIPLTVKESIAVEGASNTAGKVFTSGKRAIADAPVIKLCKNAGSIPLLVSSTPELSASFETKNNVIGTSCNPYDHRRTPGGSSGGEGALLAAAASLIGVGSDIYGSVRLPAHFCGIWGHKPSPNAVSIEGHYPLCKHREEWKKVFTLGPMSRYAGDLSLLLSVMMEKDFTSTLRLNVPVDIKTINFYFMDYNNSILTHPLDKDTKYAMEKLINYLISAYSQSVKQIKVEKFKYATELSIIKTLSFDDVEGLFENKGKGWLTEMIKYVTGRSKSVLVIILLRFLKRLVSLIIPNWAIKKCDNNLSKLKNELTDILGSNGVLLCPCHPTSAHFHGQMYGKLLDYSLMGIFNCLGLPVTNCPLGLNSDGLPVGVQVIAAANNDRLTLAVAEEIERVFGGWVPPQI